jgi:DNA-binding beta-propeller fold protein YncE
LNHFTYDPATGRLFRIGCLRDVRRAATGCDTVPGPRPIFIASPSSVAVAQDGATVYVTGRESSSLVPFAVDPRNGSSPTQRGCFLDLSNLGQGCTRKVEGLDGASDAVVISDGRAVFAMGAKDLAIAEFQRENGTVTPTDPRALPGGADTTAPETTIDSAPKPKTRSSNATFTFSADENATFECSFDGDDFDACSSPHTVTGIAKGRHFFQVVAIDTAGNRDGSPARVDFKVKAPRRR